MNLELETLLTDKYISPTAMRLLVLEYLLNQSSAISLKDLEEDFQHSERTTLYRTLKTFEEKGLIHSIQDGSGFTKYALCSSNCKEGNHHDLHVHFYCYSCKETFCLSSYKIPNIPLPKNFQLEELSLNAKGICDKCKQINAIELHAHSK